MAMSFIVAFVVAGLVALLMPQTVAVWVGLRIVRIGPILAGVAVVLLVLYGHIDTAAALGWGLFFGYLYGRCREALAWERGEDLPNGQRRTQCIKGAKD